MSILQDYKKQMDKGAAFGFQWTNYSQIIQQIKSECDEVEKAIENGSSTEHVQEELGDLINVSLNLATYLKFDLEETINKNMKKYDARLNLLIEAAADQGLKSLKGLPYEEKLKLWRKAKDLV